MSRNPDKQARVEAILGELTELGLMLARDLATQARLRESGGRRARRWPWNAAFDKTARAVVRPTLALDAKLERDAAADARLAEQDQIEAERVADCLRREEVRVARAAEPVAPVEARKTRVRGLMNRLIWNESEGDEEDYEVLLEDLNARLDEAALSPDFEDLPLETLTRRVIADMGLTARFDCPEPRVRSNPAGARGSHAVLSRLQAADTG